MRSPRHPASASRRVEDAAPGRPGAVFRGVRTPPSSALESETVVAAAFKRVLAVSLQGRAGERVCLQDLVSVGD
jgi:hypothetical protein